MSMVSCNTQNQLFQQGIMTVKVAYNMADSVAKAQNQRQIATYSGITGLPDLSAPLMVENVTNVKDSSLIDNGKGVIVPPDTYLAFEIAFGCQVGFGFGIEILPSSISIVDNNSLILPRSSVPSTNEWAVCSQYAFFTSQNKEYDQDMIYVYDNNFGTHSLDQQIAAHSYQIRITCTPVRSWTDSNGNTYAVDRPNLNPPSNPPNLRGLVAAQDGDINVHGGTVTGSGTSGQKYGGCRGYTMDSQSVSMVFDVFVINQKYYTTQTYQLFTSNAGDGLND